MKRQYNLYLDIDSMEILKARNVNVSQFISGLVEVEAGLTPEDKTPEVDKLKLANAKLIERLHQQKEEYEKKLKEKNKEKTKRIFVKEIPDEIRNWKKSIWDS